MRLSQDELSKKLVDAKQRVKIGSHYRHYKSPDMTYKVKDIVIQEVDNEPCVIYQAEYGNKITFSRPVNVWLQKVESDGSLMQRFTKID